MDDYILLAIPRSQDQLHHVANSIMKGIHDVFSLDKDDKEDAIYLKKILKKESALAIIKNVLVFEFDGNPGEHTIWLTEDRRTDILEKFKKWIKEGEHIKRVILLRSFKRILQNWEMPLFLSQMVRDCYLHATRCWARSQKISSYIVITSFRDRKR